MKVTAKAPANIAFIKYWGKTNEKLRLPENDSLAMTLDQTYTTTTVEFSDKLKQDRVFIDGSETTGEEKQRVVKQLNLIRPKASLGWLATVVSLNNFPKASGLASSASGLAALTIAASAAAGLKLNQKELGRLARLGSGSACRSIPGGYVYWQKGQSDQDSYAYTLYNADYWDLVDLTVVVTKEQKKISSTEGHSLTKTNPFSQARQEAVRDNLKEIKKAFKTKDFTLLGQVIESECLNLHSVMLTSKPALIYWESLTLEIIHKAIQWRQEGLESYFTIDAGPQVHLICQGKNSLGLKNKLKSVRGILDIITNRPSQGARIIDRHLF